MSILFSLKLIFLSEKNPYFGKHLFAKQELITRESLRAHDFATGKNFSFNRASDRVWQKMGNSAAFSREIMWQERSIMRQIMRFF